MPIQTSKRGQSITPAQFEAPFESSFTRFGVKGLNITDAIDAIGPDELSRMLNVTHRQDYGITPRPGQTLLTNIVGTNHHSVRRLNDPLNSTYTRIHGIDTSLYFGQTVLNNIDSGYSGSPLTMVPYRPPFSSETWMFVADSARMRKVRPDGLDLPIGLPAPGSACTTALGTLNKTVIASFTGADNTDKANWTGTPGFTYSNPPATIDGTEILDSTDGITDASGNPGIHFGALEATPTPDGYYAFYGCPINVDLSKVGGVAATDDDYIHVEVNFSHTQFIKEFRIYLVCSAAFSPTVLPGIADASAVNGDAYFKAFSANDFSAYVQAQQIQTNAAEVARVTSLRDQQLKLNASNISDLRQAQLDAIGDASAAVPIAVATVDQTRTITQQSNAGSDQWQPFGVISIPLRRGDFQRIGTTVGRGWQNITGIVTYIQTGPSAAGDPVGTVAVRIAELYMNGGAGPDSGEAPDSPYDYRFTNYDPRTGAEGNPSPEQTAALYLDSLRRSIIVTPAAYGDGSIRQRFYRRGGTLVDDWYFLGENTSDGGVYTDILADTEIEAAGVVELDNDQPVSTVDANGNTVLDQPLSALWGPLDDLLFGCGDKYRPGNIYFCKPGEPDSWPPDNRTEVCSPSEQLQTGCLFGGQSFVFSTERLYVLYPNHSTDAVTVTSTVTQCTRGIVNRWGLAVGLGGMYFIANDGIYRTVGGPEEWISRNIDPLFRGQSKNGMKPIDMTSLTDLRLELFENELYFQYKDTEGNQQCLVYSLPYAFWRQYTFGAPTACFYNDEGNANSVMIIGGKSSGKTYTFSGTSDDGTAISCQVRTGAINFGAPRLEKRFGDQFLDIDTDGLTITLQNYLDYETNANPVETFTNPAGRVRAVIDAFGVTPQRAANIATDISWSSSEHTPSLFQLGTTIIHEPDITINRVTQWDEIGNADQMYLMGVAFDCDTGGVDRTVVIEKDYQGAVTTVSTLTVNANGRRKLWFSWTGTIANKVRVRPSGDCDQWILYKADWNFQPQPPAISKWDVYFENAWDQYYTGVDLFCDTYGLDKTVQVFVDGTLVKQETVNTNGRLVHHITIPWGRGHVFRFIATDDNPGTLYDYRWHLDPEPSEQTNWNQNFTVEGIESDKYLKAIVFQCDTFGQDKTVTVECDGVVVETLTINTSGRKVVQKAFPQHLGRVFRIYPTDDFPGRLYTLWWVFDTEPLALARWETQEITHDIPGWSYATYAHVTLKSVSDVTLTIIGYNQSGVGTTKTYTIPSTGGQKMKVFVPFEAMKAILHKYIVTSADPFWLYREETAVFIREWGTDKTALMHIFGNDDIDTTRVMTKAAQAAVRIGGGTA